MQRKTIIKPTLAGKLNRLNPMRVIVFGFAAVILIGTLLLSLPISTRDGNGAPFNVAIFTATSATCVTGLVLKDTYTYWSTFGQTIILLMIQIGGLGFMSVATLISIIVGRTISLRERLLLVQSYNVNDISGIVRLAKHIIFGTFIIEGIGALILSTRFIGDFGWKEGLFKSVFHSISAFCNAGFDLMGQVSPFTSMVPYQNDPLIILSMSALIIIGGIGFYVWEEIIKVRSFKKLSTYSKLIIIMTAFLILGGASLFLLLEHGNPKTMGELDWGGKILSSLFQSITPRTAGFNSIDQVSMLGESKGLTMMLMFIGGASGSTAGGVKVGTAGIIIFAVISYLRGKSSVVIGKRTIQASAVISALTITVVALSAQILGASIIYALNNVPFTWAMFEATSANATVGLSMGITPSLSLISQAVLISLMFFGRVGLITISLALLLNQGKRESIRYPESKMIIG